MLIHFIIRFSTPLSSTLDNANFTRETFSLMIVDDSFKTLKLDTHEFHPNISIVD
jgi:hypothetical protein